MSDKIIVHISEVDVSLNSGMGRVEWYWKKAFENRGYTFIHIGPKEVGPYKHPGIFPYKAKQYLAGLAIKPVALIVHEPAAGYFVNEKILCFVESHGVEQRFWELWKAGRIDGLAVPSFKSTILFPLWRLFFANKGLRKAHKLLLLNNEDSEFVQSRFQRKSDDIFVFDNGVDLEAAFELKEDKSELTVLYNASWIPRKGITTLIKAISILKDKGIKFRLLLIGTGTHVAKQEILNSFPPDIDIEVIPTFNKEDEIGYLRKADIFVLPSFYEGKPLSLLQAMSVGLCCITTNTCGQKDIINDGENGLLFEIGDYETLAKQLYKVLSNKELRKKTGQNASKDVAKYGWEVVSSRVVDYVLQNC